MSPATEKDKLSKSDARTITVTVFALNSTEGKSFTWDKTMKVGDAALEAAAAFGITDENTTLSKDGKTLDRSKPLVAEHVGDGDQLELVSTGGGV